MYNPFIINLSFTADPRWGGKWLTFESPENFLCVVTEIK